MKGIQLLIDRGYTVVVGGYNPSGIYSVHSDDKGGAYG